MHACSSTIYDAAGSLSSSIDNRPVERWHFKPQLRKAICDEPSRPDAYALFLTYLTNVGDRRACTLLRRHRVFYSPSACPVPACVPSLQIDPKHHCALKEIMHLQCASSTGHNVVTSQLELCHLWTLLESIMQGRHMANDHEGAQMRGDAIPSPNLDFQTSSAHPTLCPS